MTDLFSYDDVHELLKSSILDMDNVVQEIHTSKEGGDVSWKEAASPYYEKMCQCGHNAMLAGQQYASWFDPDLSKSAFDFDWDYRSDIDQMAGGLGIPVSKKNVDTLHRALANGEPIPTRELEKDFDYEKAQDVGRTVMLNIYAKAALRRWDGDGIVHCRRIEMRDRKTCPICRSLHGKQYVIREVLNQLYPQSHDTHPRCRGTFLPVLDTATTYKPQRQEFPAGINFTVAGNVAENVPMEIKPWLYTFMRRSPVPLHVKFDDALDAAYEWDGFEVTISPEALKHEDPREIILRSVADQIWPEVQPEFSEYKNLVKGGHAIPAKSWENDKELFVNNYIAYRMGQDEYPRSVAWLKRVAG